MRESGYYWVKSNDVWIVAEYVSDAWFDFWVEPGDDTRYSDDTYDEIGERIVK